MKFSLLTGSMVLLMAISSFSLHAQQRRIALVIGNSEYSHSGSLKNPVNDAEVMAKTLESLDFTVIKELNADKSKMEKVIYEFSKRLNDYNVALFYYAGHGIQVGGRNFLLPTDAVLEDKIAAEFEAIDVSKVVSQFERYPNNTNIVILDACRNNPFKSFSRGGESGFAAIPAPSGTIIAYATAEGSTASDGVDNNGLYTSVLTEEMKKSQRIEDVFINTRIRVRQISNAEQSPQEWSQLTGKFYFATNGVESTSEIKPNGLNSDASQKAGTGISSSGKSESVALDRGKIASGGYTAKSHMADLIENGYTLKQLFDLGVPESFLYGLEYGGGIIASFAPDRSTCLIVAKNDQSRGVSVKWEEANALCSFFTVQEFEDWRLPNKEELLQLYSNLKSNDFGTFTNESYWSATTSGYNNAWGVSFSSGRNYDFDKLSTHHVRAVRSVSITK